MDKSLFTNKWIHVTRFLIIITIAGIGWWINQGGAKLLLFYVFIIGISYSFIGLAIEKLVPHYISFRWIIFIADAIFITILIYASGGMNSQVSLLYMVHIAIVSIYLYTRGAFVIASVDALLFSLLGFALMLGIIKDPYRLTTVEDSKYLMQIWFVKLYLHILVFYLVAAITGYLSERLQKRKEEVEHLEKIIRNIVKNLNVCLVAVDEDNNIIISNSACEKIFNKELSRDKNILDIFSFNKDLIDIFKEGIIKGNITMDVDWNGKFLYFISHPLFIGKERKGTIFTIEDISRRRTREKLAVLGEMMSSLAHEVRNPLSSIRGIIEVVLRNMKTNDKEIMDIGNLLVDEVSRIDRIINSILDYSKSKPLYIEHVDINKLIEDVVNLMETHPVYKEKNPLIIYEVEDNLFFDIDRSKFLQILYNLIINGIEHNNEVRPKVYIKAMSDNKNLIITVTDNGYGIPQNIGDRIFEPFFSTNSRGTGIGLAVVKRLVEEHGGTVSVISEENKGTQFIIKI